MSALEGFGGLIFAVGRMVGAEVQLLGTAFPLGGKKFATAGHVTGQSDANLMLSAPKVRNLSDYQDAGDRSSQMIPARIAHYDPVADIAILESDDVSGSPNIHLAGTDEVRSGDKVASLGFPHCGDGRQILTHQSTTVGAKVLLPVGPLKRKHLVLNTLTRPGQSGSPVFIGDTNRICAMILGSYIPPGHMALMIGNIDPASLHQTTHAISVEYLRAMI